MTVLTLLELKNRGKEATTVENKVVYGTGGDLDKGWVVKRSR